MRMMQEEEKGERSTEAEADVEEGGHMSPLRHLLTADDGDDVEADVEAGGDRAFSCPLRHLLSTPAVVLTEDDRT